MKKTSSAGVFLTPKRNTMIKNAGNFATTNEDVLAMAKVVAKRVKYLTPSVSYDI